MNKTIALCMIVRDDADEISSAYKAFTSVAEHIDAAYVTLTGDGEKKNQVSWANESYFTWTDDFAAARNFNFSQAKEDWILWVDADDIVLNPQAIRELVNESEKLSIDGYSTKYLYDKDDKGHVTTWHWKTRLVKNDGHCKWAGRIHEDLLQERQANWKKTVAFAIDHNSTDERRADSIIRNTRILLDEIKKQGDNPDPRTLFYLGTAYMQMEEWEKAGNCFWRYLELSEWDEERYEVYQRLCEILMHQGRLDDALEVALKSTTERPDYPDAYFTLAKIYQLQENWGKSCEWSRVGFSKKTPDTNIIVFPKKLTTVPLSVYAYSLMNLGQLDEALSTINKALEYSPDEEYLKDMQGLISNLLTNKNLVKSYVKLAGFLKDHGEADKIVPLLQAVPKRIKDNPMITKVSNDFFPAKIWPKGSIVFLCGLTAESWSPKSLDKGGIGGSETAVIHLAKRLAAKGHDVTVFNWCDIDEGDYDGVHYRNYWTMRTVDKFDTLVLWRSPVYLDYGFEANNIIVDLHDVPNPTEFTEERLKGIKKIFVKSQYHRELLPQVSNEKIEVIPNGIDITRYEKLETPEPNSVIYSSAPNRGLDIILDLWPRIREKVPEATLRVFYGWKTFYELQKNNPASLKWMKKIQDKVESLKDQGVIDMGRVGQQELSEWQKRSMVWFYPTYFPEISCITGMEVQAAGCVPVCTDYAALNETVQYGVKVHGDAYEPKVQDELIDGLVLALKGNAAEREAMSSWAKQTYAWDTIAEAWEQHIK